MLRDRLRHLYPNTSGRRLKQWLEAGRIRVNDVVVRRADVAIGSGDRVVLGAPPPAPFPASLRLVAMLDRPDLRTVELTADYHLFHVSEGNFVGYGLELDGRYGNLPYIGRSSSS